MSALPPAILFDFARGRILDPRAAFTRVSGAMVFSPLGAWRAAQPNTARFAFDVNGRCLGLVVEPEVTNGVRNPLGEGVVAGAPGTLPTNWIFPAAPSGLAREMLAPAVVAGITYARVRYSGTASSAAAALLGAEAYNVIAAATGQVWTQSAYVALVVNSGETPAVKMANRETAANGTTNITADSLAPDLALTATPTLQHRTTTMAASTAFVAPTFRVSHVTSSSYDYELWVGTPQVEQSPCATSPVLPAAGAPAASTRSAETFASPLASYGFANPTAGTLLLAGRAPKGGGAVQPVLYLDDGTPNNRIAITRSAARVITAEYFTAGVSGGLLAGTDTVADSADFTVAIACGAGDLAISTNGGAASTGAPSGFPLGMTRLALDGWGGTIERIAYWPERLPSADLRHLSA